MSIVIHATPVAVDPWDCARAARRSAAVAAPLMSLGAGLLVAGLTFMDPSKSDSVPQALSGGAEWATADRLLVAIGLAALTAAAVLAGTGLRDRHARHHLGRRVLSDGGYALAVFVIGPWLLMWLGHSPPALDDWARPSAALVGLTGGLSALGVVLLGTSRRSRTTPA